MNIVNVGYLSCNYYMVEQDRKRLLIDVGWPGSLPKLFASLRGKGMVLEDLGFLCITHYHPDPAASSRSLKTGESSTSFLNSNCRRFGAVRDA